jgi:hypothetical protein
LVIFSPEALASMEAKGLTAAEIEAMIADAVDGKH